MEVDTLLQKAMKIYSDGRINTKWLNPKAGTGPVYFKCLDCGEEWSESDSDRAEED
jgi:hypothetical protein